MKYPINIERDIAVMRERFGENARAAEICRDCYLPALNDAYRDGQAGESGYPMLPETEISDFERAEGPVSDCGRRLIGAFVRDLNAAYAEGERAAPDRGGKHTA